MNFLTRMKRMALRALGRSGVTGEFLALLDELDGVSCGEYDQRTARVIDDARDLVRHGEEGVAFESLCENLHEWGFPLSREHHEKLKSLAPFCGLDESACSFLEERKG